MIAYFSNLIIDFTSGPDFNLKSAHYYYLPNVSIFFYSSSSVNKKHLNNKLLQFPFLFFNSQGFFHILDTGF